VVAGPEIPARLETSLNHVNVQVTFSQKTPFASFMNQQYIHYEPDPASEFANEWRLIVDPEGICSCHA
jgi:hypothetical protein